MRLLPAGYVSKDTEEIKYYSESDTSSNKHINHGQVYNQVHGTSAKLVRRLLFFTKIMIDRRFTATTATVIVTNTAYHVLHSAEEIAMELTVFF